jgi:tetratricopeptide (TPR) repeat protein
MKKTGIVWGLVLMFTIPVLRAQNCEIPLMAVVYDNNNALPDDAEQYLKDKLIRIITQNGVNSNGNYAQFMLSARIALLTKDILPGPPINISQTMNVSFYIVDYFGEKVLATSNIEIQAVGNNETKAYINGIRNISENNKDIVRFVREGKEKIIAYYDANYANIINKAKNLAGMKRYEEALFYLTSIPECGKGYDLAMASCREIYQKYINQTCLENLNLARTAWLSEQDAGGAEKAGCYLVNIYPDAGCYNEAMKLYEEIKGRVHEDRTFELKRYNDNVSLETQRIEAYKAVGVAFGKGQQPVTTNIGVLR